MQKITRRTSNTYQLRARQHRVLPALCAGWLLALLLVLPRVGHAQFSYITNNGALTLTGYTGAGGAVTIPDTVDGLPVSNIGERAFSGCFSQTSVSIPDSVTNIGAHAFSGCSSLTSVRLPASLITMGEGAFFDCVSLSSVTLPASLTSLGDFAFGVCFGLTNISGGGGLTSIGNGAFGDCSSLADLTIPDGVTNIGDGAFERCSSLVNLTIPDGVTNIGGWAFAGCSSLTNVTLPSSVQSIGWQVFASCSGLMAITVDALNPAYSSVDGVLFDKDQTTLLACPGGKAGDYLIPDGVTNIEGAFCSCAKLTSVTLPSSVTRVGDIPYFRFVGCTSLAAIIVAPQNPAYSSLEGVLFDKSQSALLACPMGKGGRFTIPDSTVTIASDAFANCGRLTDITLGHGVALIESEAFANCVRLASVQLPNSLTNIADEAFENCGGLTNVTIPSQVTHLGTRAFGLCQSLKAISVEALNPNYSSVAGVLFNKRQTMLVQYPSGKAGSYTIPSSVTNIGDFAFAKAVNLTCIAGGARLRGIGQSAFEGCINLTNIAVLSSVVELGNYVFRSCDNLTALTVGPRLASLGAGTFADCGHLTEVFFQGDAPNAGGNPFADDDGVTVYYLSGKQGWETTFGDCPTALWNGNYTITVSATSLTDSSSGGLVAGGGTFVGGHWRTVRATAGPGYVFANWTESGEEVSTSPSYTFMLLGDRELVANFAPNPFPALAGTYHGLIGDTNAAWPGSSGCFTLSVTARGNCTGTTQVGGVRSGFSGQFDYTGHLLAQLPAGGLELQLDGASTLVQVSGTLSNQVWTVQVAGEQAVFNAKTQPATNCAGRYTLVLPGGSGATPAPVGESWATLSVTPSGLVYLKAALADGTKLTQGASLVQEGAWPLYAALYQRRGLLMGWMGLANTPTSDVSGSVIWTRPPPQAEGDAGGFGLTTTATGSRYVPPVGAAVLSLTNAALVLAGPGLTQELTNFVTLQPDSQVESTNHTRLTFNLATGTFKGSVPNPDDPKARPLAFSGVVLQKQNYGGGWFGEPDLWGKVTLGQCQ